MEETKIEKHPTLKGDENAHKKARQAAALLDEWLGQRKRVALTRVETSSEAWALLEGVIFGMREELRAKGFGLQIFRPQWGLCALIRISDTGKIFEVAVKKSGRKVWR